MSGPVKTCMLLAALAVATSSCTRLPDPGEEGALALEELAQLSSVPAAWGNLIAVAALPGQQTQLWFQDAEGTVRLVLFSWRTEQLSSRVRVISRR